MNGNQLFHSERAESYCPQDDQPLVAFTLAHPHMIARFGPAHRQMGVEDNEPGPCEYWSFKFPCGLITFITFHFHIPTGPGGDVVASSPDVEHILQHLPIRDCLIWRLDHNEPDFYRQRYSRAAGKDSCILPLNV